MSSSSPSLKVLPALDFDSNGGKIAVVTEESGTVTQDNVSVSGKLTVEFLKEGLNTRWFFKCIGHGSGIKFGECKIKFGSRELLGEIYSIANTGISGFVIDSVTCGTEHKLSQVTTHFQEFPYFKFQEESCRYVVAQKIKPLDVDMNHDGLKVTLCSCRGIKEANGFKGLMKVTALAGFHRVGFRYLLNRCTIFFHLPLVVGFLQHLLREVTQNTKNSIHTLKTIRVTKQGISKVGCLMANSAAWPRRFLAL